MFKVKERENEESEDEKIVECESTLELNLVGDERDCDDEELEEDCDDILVDDGESLAGRGRR